MSIFVVVFLLSSPAYAILDMLSTKMDDMIDASILADSLNELSQEIIPDSQVSSATEKVKVQTDSLLKNYREARDLDADLEDLGSDFTENQWSSGAFESNVRHTTHFIRRIKRLAVTLGIRPKAAAAYGSFETALALNQMIKNQNEVIALMQSRYLQEENKRIKDQVRTNRFIKNQLKEISKRRI